MGSKNVALKLSIPQPLEFEYPVKPLGNEDGKHAMALKS